MRSGRQEMIQGVRPNAALTCGCRRGIGVVCLVLAAAIASVAQDGPASPNVVKLKTLANFDGANGNKGFLVPNYAMVQGTDGNLYGTTFVGGANSNSNICGLGCGTVFRITPAGALTTAYSFCADPNCIDGAGPYGAGALALDTYGNLYGTTAAGGTSANSGPCAPSGCGTIFEVTPSHTVTLYSFCSQPNCVDGDSNYSGVVRGADGNFYGVTPGNGANSNSLCGGGFLGLGCGTVFRITPQGAFNTIYSFCSLPNCADGDSPYTGLVSGADGNLYGITSGGGANNYGTIFRLTLKGKLTTLHSLGTGGNCGGFLCAPMVQAGDGNFYGTMTFGGGGTACTFGPGCGTVFKITPGGPFATLYNFCSQANCADGRQPFGVVQGTDRNLYGVAESDGANSGCAFGDCGTVFRITSGGSLTTLHSFDGSDGSYPNAMAQATNGIFYGTTDFGGANSDGTVFGLSAGLGPFVETLPTAGKVGDAVQILGTNLANATGVSFNGTVAAFTMTSKSLISATVPTGATTGLVTVTGPGGTLKSNLKFQVRP